MGGPHTENRLTLWQKARFWVQRSSNKIETEGLGPPWLDPARNSVQDPITNVENGGMATHLVTNLGDLGRLGFRPQLAHTGVCM